MVCKVCGRTVENEHNNFCGYCGASLRDMELNRDAGMDSHQYQQSQPIYQQNVPQWDGSSNRQSGTYNPGMNQQPYHQGSMYQQSMNSGAGMNKSAEPDAPMSFRNWFGIMFLPYIPVVGWIIYIIMLIVWSFDKTTPVTKKNWARARLLSGVIIGVIGLIYFSMVIKGLEASGLNLQDFVQKSLNNSYY